MALGIGLAGGWVTARDGRHRRRVPRPRDHPVRGLPLDRPRRPVPASRPRGRGDRGQAPAAEGLARHRAAGARFARPVSDAVEARRSERRAATTAARPATARRAVRPHPVLRLALPVLRLRRRGRRGHARADEPDRGVRGRAPGRSSGSGPTPWTRRFGAPGSRPPAAPGDGLSRRRHADASCRPTSSRGLLELIRRAVRRSPTTPRSRSRRTRDPTSAATRAAWLGPGSTGSRSAPRASIARQLRRLGRRHRPADVADAVDGARAGGHRLDQPGPRCTTSRTARSATWIDTLEAALELEPDHLSLYALTLDDPDAEGLTGPGGDHLPTPARRPSLARRRRSSSRTRTGPPPSTTTPSTAWATDGWRGYEISNWAQPGHESRHNLAYWERRPYEAVGPGAHAFDGATRRWNAAHLGRYVDALTPSAGSGRAAAAAAGRRRDARPGDRGGRDGDPRAPHGPRPAALRRARAAACRRSSAGRSPRSS